MSKEFIRIGGAREHNLKNLTLEIPRDKLVVITGLSGSGKSSLLAALFRLPLRLDAGRILIDGVDIASVNVYHLRSRLAIIPQVPATWLQVGEQPE